MAFGSVLFQAAHFPHRFGWNVGLCLAEWNRTFSIVFGDSHEIWKTILGCLDVGWPNSLNLGMSIVWKRGVTPHITAGGLDIQISKTK